MDEKDNFGHFEGAQKATAVYHDESAKHGDRALSIIGDERVTLTEEEVRSYVAAVS